MGKKRAGRKPESSSSVLDSGSDTSDHETVGNEAISRHSDDAVPAAETTGVVESSHVDNSEVDSPRQIPNVDVNETVVQPSVLDIAREAVESLQRSPRPTLTKAMIIESRLKSAAAANVKKTPEAEGVQSDLQQTGEALVNPAGRSSKRLKKGGASSIAAEMAKLKASYVGKKTVKHVSFETAKNDSHPEEAAAAVKEVKKKPPVAVKRKVVFESTGDDKGADKIAKKSPKSPIKKKTDKSTAGGKRKASAEPSDLEEVLVETTIKSAKTRSASASSKKKLSTATHEPEKVLNNASKEMWSLRWKLEEIPTTRVDHCMKHKVVDKLKSHLTDSQLEMFRATCFGFVLDMPSCNFQGQVVHSLLARQFDNAGENEMWFAVGQLKVRFSIEEFAILTGLNCTGEIQKVGFEDGANHFAEKYFGGLSKLNRQSVAECFVCKRWQSDEDAVKIAFLYVLELYFLCALDSNLIEGHHLDVIASEDYNSYPWGKEIFYYTLKSFKSKDLTKKFKNEGYCRLLGFPIILQFLFYECFPTADGKICTLVGNKVPRCLNWSSSITPTVDDLESNFYNLGSELRFERILPTTEEKRILMLDGFFSGKRKASRRNVQSSVDEEVPVFNDAAVSSLLSASTNNQQEINNMSKRVVNVEKQLKVVISDMSVMKKEIKTYHVDMEKGMAEIGGVLKDLVSKMERHFAKSKNITRGDDQGDDGDVRDLSGSSSESEDDNQKNDYELKKAEATSVVATVDGKTKDVSAQDCGANAEKANEDTVMADANPTQFLDSDELFSDSVIATLDKTVASVYKSRDIAALIEAGCKPDGTALSFNDVPCPFLNSDYTDSDAYRDAEIFNWIEKGWNSKLCCLTGKYSVINPPLEIGGDVLTKKMFFHTLNFCGGELSTSHIDVIFYYLRKRIKLMKEKKIKFSTTDSCFSQILVAEYECWKASGSPNVFEVGAGNTLFVYFSGGVCRYGKPWKEVDELLCPLLVLDPNHWILVRVNFEECKVYVYNSYKTEKIEKNIELVIGAFTEYIPVFLKQTNFYASRKESVSFALSSSYDSRYGSFSLHSVSDLPTQVKSDCGAFICLFAERLIDGKRIPSSFSVEEMELYRNRLCHGLITYGRWKGETNYISEGEGTVKLRRELNKYPALK